MEQQEAKRKNHADAVHLMAFENRYEEADADRFASFPNYPNTFHNRSMKALSNNSMKIGSQAPKRRSTASADAGLYSAKRNNYDYYDDHPKETTVERGVQFLPAERARHVENGHNNPGKDVGIAFTQFEKLFCLQSPYSSQPISLNPFALKKGECKAYWLTLRETSLALQMFHSAACS